MMQKACLRVENLHKTFTNGAESLAILRGVTAAFDQGGLYAITGVSGSGKSTLMHLLAGIDSPTKGEVLFNGVNLAQLGQDERERFLQQSIGLVFQLPYLISELSVIENIMVPGLISGKTKTECCIRAMEILEAVGLADKALCNPHSLSGGQQQRVALARALYNKPVFLIADEPTGSLDEHASRGIIDLLLDCQREWGMGVIISSHDMYVTNCMKTIYHLKDGILSARNNESFEIA